jgi:hypothetical protein
VKDPSRTAEATNALEILQTPLLGTMVTSDDLTGTVSYQFADELAAKDADEDDLAGDEEGVDDQEVRLDLNQSALYTDVIPLVQTLHSLKR